MKSTELNIFARVLRWKAYIQDGMARLLSQSAQLESDVNTLRARCNVLERQIEALTRDSNQRWLADVRKLQPEALYFEINHRQCFARRGGTIRMLALEAGSDLESWLSTNVAEELADAVSSGKVDLIEAARVDADGRRTDWESAPSLLRYIRENPGASHNALKATETRPPTGPAEHSCENASALYARATRTFAGDPDLIDFVAQSQATVLPQLAGTADGVPLPFDDRDRLPAYTVPAEPRRRSVLLLHHSYYYYSQLAAGLRRRGWDALTASLESPSSPQRQFYHGEDINLFDPDAARMRARIREFLQTIPERFSTVHFYGRGNAGLFRANYEYGECNEKVPWDFLELKRHRVIIGYTPSGCLDGPRQSSIRRVTSGVCSRCIWERHPEICSDGGNLAWGAKVDVMCDWIGLEGDWVTPERMGPKFVTRPIITALSEEKWHPNLEVPDEMRVGHSPGELLVYHAVGNDESRRREGRDIKGTGAVLAAIERLRAEGFPVRLFFATGLPSTEVRFYQVQADIVVDQLNYGRLGANARESMMLGRPLITCLDPSQDGRPPLQYIADAPAMHATETTVYDVLKSLLQDPGKRGELGLAARAFALKWHTPDVCALRFERVIDRVRAGLPAEADEVFQ